MDARTLIVQPWEKSVLNDISKGIIDANLVLTLKITENSSLFLFHHLPRKEEEI